MSWTILHDAITNNTEMLAAGFGVSTTPIFDHAGTPGPQSTRKHFNGGAYFGFTPANELISGDALALQIGLSAGTSQHSDAGWLKWMKDGAVMFVAKKALRNNVSWNNINAVGAVFGSKTVNIGGKTYKVRLLTGANADPGGATGGEWNIVMYGAHINELPMWDSFDDCGLLVSSDCGTGSYNWCQEVSSSNSANRIVRGGGPEGVASIALTSAASAANVNYGWRPVLELVQ